MLAPELRDKPVVSVILPSAGYQAVQLVDMSKDQVMEAVYVMNQDIGRMIGPGYKPLVISPIGLTRAMAMEAIQHLGESMKRVLALTGEQQLAARRRAWAAEDGV